MPPRPEVAIACQGGGSHAAFSAGLLGALLSEAWRDRFDLVALSGTSGGALCAALAWRGLVAGGAEEARQRLAGFWQELAAQDLLDAMLNFWAVTLARMPVSAEISPYSYDPVAAPRLLQLLQKHLALEDLPMPRPAIPGLCIGATEVLTGERTIFQGERLDYPALIASAAIPPLYRAVAFEGRHYWDGLFASNPPVRELIGWKPEELWVVQINPQRRAEEPRSIRDITDRRNELAGNLSLAQELFFIEKINALCARYPALAAGEGYREIRIRVVELALEGLDYPSKLDRSAALLQRLQESGAERAAWFFDERSAWPRPGCLVPGSVAHDAVTTALA